MSVYAIIPLERESEIKENYLIAAPGSWYPTRNESGLQKQYVGLEEYYFTDSQRNEILECGGEIFETDAEYFTWLNKYSKI